MRITDAGVHRMSVRRRKHGENAVPDEDEANWVYAA
jgi:hypothetical protein